MFGLVSVDSVEIKYPNKGKGRIQFYIGLCTDGVTQPNCYYLSLGLEVYVTFR